MATTNLGKVSIVPRGAYDATASYTRLDLVTHNGNTYLALADSTGIAVTDATKWQQLIDTTNAQNATSYIASTYSASATYGVGDYVIQNGKLYQCKTAITTAEEWTAEHWMETKLADNVEANTMNLFQLRRVSTIEKAYVQWESGGLNSSTGAPQPDASDRQIRSGFLLAAPGEEIRFTGVSTDRLAIVCSYDKGKNYIANSRKNIISGVSYTIPANTYYVRFIYGFTAAAGQTITGYGGVDAVAADWDISCISPTEIDIDNRVSYAAAQTLTETQQATARDNIGAAEAGDVEDLKSAVDVLEPIATSSDVGKFLKAKTVSGGKVTEYEFGEGGSGSSDKIGNIYNRSYNVSGTKTAALTLSGSTESDHIIYARVEIKSEYEIENVNVKSSPANTSINIQTITTNEWNLLSYSCVGKTVIFTVRFSDRESHPYEVRNAISFDQTLEFGAGNELSASVIDQMINDDCFGQQYFSVQSDYVIGAAPKKMLGVVPKNNGNGEVSTYVECSELGNVQMSSSPNSGWSGWREIGTYGQPNIASIPVYNQVHGTLETDGMFSVLPLWGAWCVNTGGNTHHGGHLFHGWTTDRQHRLTMVQNIYSDYEAAIFNYTPGGKSEGGGAVRNEGKFNRLRIGADSSKGILIDPIYEIVNGDWVYRYTRAYFQCTPNFSINRVPTYSNSEGVKGDVCFDSNYFYACINTNSWKRFALSDFVGLTSINANYNPGGATIYEGTSLNDLKQYLTVTATLSDSSTLTVSSSDYTLSGTLTAGTSTITVSYEGKTTTFNVTVTGVTVVSISAAYNPGSAVIYDTTPLDDLKQYLTVTATYNDSTTATVSSSDYTLSGALTVGTSVITVSYSGQTTTFNVTVTMQRTLTSISANYNTSGIKIYEIDGVDMLKNNLTVTANYSDSTSETLDSEDYTLAGTLETGTTGNNVITVSYSDKSTTFNVAKSSVGQMILDPVTLPSGYTQLTYIESADNVDGGSRITTNAKMSTIARAEYGIVLPITLANNTIAATLGNTHTRFPALKISNYGTKKINYCYLGNDNDNEFEYAWMTNKGYIISGFPDVKVDGVTFVTVTAGSGGADEWLRLNSNGNSSTNSRKQRYYFMRMYDSEDNLVHNYVPCKDGSNVVGMYDTVAGRFLSSASQPFIAGDALV